MLPDGISYTHGAFWTFVPISLDDGCVINGFAVYNLYHGDGKTLAMDKSYLHQDFPIDFVAPSAVDDIAVIVPTAEMQRRILSIMDSPTYRALHIEAYSLVSNPHDIRYQNCTEFMLDIIAAAAWETADMGADQGQPETAFQADQSQNLGDRALPRAAGRGPYQDRRPGQHDHHRHLRIDGGLHEGQRPAERGVYPAPQAILLLNAEMRGGPPPAPQSDLRMRGGC